MADCLDIFIRWPIKAMRAVIALNRPIIMSCFIFIIFINFLACLNTNVARKSLKSDRFHAKNSSLIELHEPTKPPPADSAQTIDSAETEAKLKFAPRGIAPRSSIYASGITSDDSNTTKSEQIVMLKDNTWLNESSLLKHNDPELTKSSELGLGLLQAAPLSGSENYAHGGSLRSIHETSVLARPVQVTTLPTLTDEDDMKGLYMRGSRLSSSLDETTTLTSIDNQELKSEDDKTKQSSLIAEKSTNYGPDEILQSLETHTPPPATISIFGSQMSAINNSSIPTTTPTPTTSQTNRNNFKLSLAPFDTTKGPNLEQASGHENMANSHLNLSSIPMEPPLSESLILNASLIDLLHIIKHLNLISGLEKDETRSESEIRLVNKQETRSNRIEPSQPENAHPATIAKQGTDLNGYMMNGGFHGTPTGVGPHQYSQIKVGSSSDLLSTLESSSPGNIEDESRGKKLAKTSMDSRLSGRKVSARSEQATTENAPDMKYKLPATFSENSRKRPAKVSLISPYTANFESGLELTLKDSASNRGAKPTPKEHPKGNENFVDGPGVSQSPSKMSTKLSQSNEKSKTSTKFNASSAHPNMIYYLAGDSSNSDKSLKKYQFFSPDAKKQAKPAHPNSNHKAFNVAVRASAINDHPMSVGVGIESSSTIAPSDNNFKRGERDTSDRHEAIVDKFKSEANSEQYKHSAIPTSSVKSQAKLKNEQNSNTDKAVGQLKQIRKKEPQNQLIENHPVPFIGQPRPILQHAKSTHPGELTDSKPTIAGNTRPVAPSYLDDPHKKSFYWSPGQMGLSVDDLTGSNQFHRPLTIGELAQQHGITPIGFQDPHSSPLSILPLQSSHNAIIFDTLPSTGYNYSPYTAAKKEVEQFGAFSESGTSENFANLPTNHRFPATVHLGPTRDQTLGNRDLKLDDELRQKIAIKAIEAAVADPELSATLLSSLANSDNLQAPLDGGKSLPESVTNSIHNSIGSNRDSYQFSQSEVSKNLNIDALSQQISRPFIPPNLVHSLSPSISNADLLSQLSMMLPLASIPDHKNPHAITSSIQSSGNSSQPINLVITDLANKWALSRMPDLVPIPLAATVPGYLIRLPDGKILAAALTNLFSIQGIHKGPLSNNYKRLVSGKFKSILKNSASSSHDLQKQPDVDLTHHFGDTATNTETRSTVMLLNQQHQEQPTKGRIKNQKPGLFSRGMLSQLGLGTRSGQRENHRVNLAKHSTEKSNKSHMNKNRTNDKKPKIVKLTSSPFPVPSLTHQELANLPIADPREPVFAFVDESQLQDPYDYYVQSTRLNNHYIVPIPGLPTNQDQLAIEYATNSNNNNLRRLINTARSSSLLGNLGIMNDDIFNNYNSRKRKSPTRFPLSKLEPIYRWLIAIKQKKLERIDAKTCTKSVNVGSGP